MGRTGRTVIAGFDAFLMGSAAYIQTGGEIALAPAPLVLWGAALAAALCALVAYGNGPAPVAWAAIGYVLFGALLTSGGPHWPLAGLAVALMPLVPRPRGSLWIGLGLAAVAAFVARAAVAAVV